MDQVQREQTEVTPIPLDKIEPFLGQPRRAFDPEKLSGLAESIKAVGVLQAIVVRPLKRPVSDHDKVGKTLKKAGVVEATGRFELVCGERRWRAAQIADLAEIPARVVDLTDAEAKDVRLVENDQREDITPSERAAAYQERINDGVSFEDLARTVGKSVSYVRNVLRFARLSEEFQGMVDAGRVPRATAELVARVPGPQARKMIELCVLQNCYPSQVSTRGKPADEPLSYRQTKRLIEEHAQVELKGAPFPVKALGLLPAVPSCQECPSRAGNAKKSDPEYAGTRDDVCLDPGCYRKKVDAWQQRQAEEARAEGKKVLAPDECKKLFPYGPHLTHGANYVDLADQCWEDHKKKRPRSYKQLVGDKLADQVVIAFDQEGQRHALVPRKAAEDVLAKEHGIRTASSRMGGYSAQSRAADRAREKKAKARKRAAALALMHVADRAAAAFPLEAAAPDRAGPILRHLVTFLTDHSWADATRLVAQRRAPDAGGDNRATIRKLAEATEADELFGLLAELIAARAAQSWGSEWYGAMGKDEKAFWAAFGVDQGKLVRQAEAELDAQKKAKAKAKPSANGKHEANGAPAANGRAKKRAAVPAGV